MSDLQSDEYIELVRQAMTDSREVTFTISLKDLWILVSSLQLASRHPGVSSYLIDWQRQVGRQLQAGVVELMPDAQKFLEMGWDQDFDV